MIYLPDDRTIFITGFAGSVARRFYGTHCLPSRRTRFLWAIRHNWRKLTSLVG